MSTLKGTLTTTWDKSNATETLYSNSEHLFKISITITHPIPNTGRIILQFTNILTQQY